MKAVLTGAAVLLALCLSACGADASVPQPVEETLPPIIETEPAETSLPAIEAEPETSETETPKEEEVYMLQMRIGNTAVAVDWEDNESVEALIELCREAPLTVQMSMYGGFEQVGALGMSLPRSDVQTTTQSGDIVLYAGDQIVVFYGSNSWAYTRLGHISDRSAEDMAELLGHGDVSIQLFLEAQP